MSIRWVVARTMHPFEASSAITAQAIAPPWTGSVPVPSSSSSTIVLLSARLRIIDIFRTWEEKVERLSSIDWSSPISAQTAAETGKTEFSPAGTGIPDWAISVRSPAALMAMVFPPVLGPVIRSVHKRGKGCQRIQKVEFYDGLEVGKDQIRILPDPSGYLFQYPYLLGLFFGAQVLQFVNHADNLYRLHESGLAGSRYVVHDPRHHPLRVHPDRYDPSAVSL